MTTPVGPSAPQPAGSFLPVVMVQLTVSSADFAMSTYFNSGICRRIVPQAAGTVFLQLAGDSAAQSYVATAGTPIDGEIILVGGASNYASASAILVNLMM